jgi:ketosteroid isomerase-like protein
LPKDIRAVEFFMSELAEFSGNASQELASFIREGLQAFIEFFHTSQFDKMAEFYSSDTTLMLPHRGVIRGADNLPGLFRELKDTGLLDWRIEPNRMEQFGDTALEYGTYSTLIRQPDGADAVSSGKYLVVWRRQANSRWLIHADIANSDDSADR